MNKQAILRDFIETVWNQGKIDAIPDFIAAQYHIEHDPGDPWDGQRLDVAGFQNRVAQSRAPVPDQCFDIQALFDSDDSVCMTWLWHGTHLGEIAGIPPSGKTLRMSGATVYRFDGQRISGHWQVADRLGVFQQLQANR
ncbi:ester cyclase [Solimonas sp. C16B3]|uniref:Ester cyclase n=2 Tax=Solimonas marina TaxID=2714601 RepID=A0A969W7E1_9GAMM|nr:ester cyclase [Solimonas marina]